MAFAPKGYKVFNDVKNLRNLLLQERKNFGEEIDFYLLDFRTFYSKKGENKYKPVNDTGLFNKNANFTANIDIKQIYKIEICKKSEKPARTFGIKLVPNENTTLHAVLLCNNQIKHHEELKSEIYQELYKTMILQDYLIGIREYGKLTMQIDAFINSLIRGKISPKTILTIGTGVANTEGKDGEVKIYQNLQTEILDKESQEAGVFAPRICMQAVRKGDELFEYIKPVAGRVGRNLKGEILAVKPVQANAVSVDASIRAREDVDRIKFQAGKDGFFKEIKPLYFIISDELNTKQSAPKKQDEATTENTSKTPTPPPKALNIEGQTHSKSKIQTDTAFIGSHRGAIKAHTVVIDVLEKGSVEAKVAYINSTLGGTIMADYIYIKDVRSYNEIYPRYSLVVDNVLGEHNTFELNPAKFSFMRRDRLEYVMLSDQIKIRLRHLRKQMDEFYAYLLASQGKVHKIQHDQEEKPDEPLPKNLQSIVEQYEKALEHYKEHLVEYNEIVNLYYTNEVRLKSIDEGALNAKMMIRGNPPAAETMIKFKAYTGNREETLKTILSQEAPAHFFEVIKDGDFFRLRSNKDFDLSLLSWIDEMRPQQQ
ncbi:flagellar assembly protein A [Helicobacter sp.]|uniref:flagellar assembly protein A n=1 Tax=Helicobacter sp. TaxID=218 RepID=UPI0019A83F64|nr:flagellar assembly protein A [Helicobacter sp.]MBD5165393.1 DUF342 domain-containing protein [Helicobacter sp.]